MNVHETTLGKVQRRIHDSCLQAGRDPGEVRLLAVSKRHPSSAVRAMAAAGQLEYGENQLQEALPKMDDLRDLPLIWHFIGPVQSNKTREIAARFDWVQSLDREKIMRRLAVQRPDRLPPLNVCLQVNIDEEPQKAGLAMGQVAAFAAKAEHYGTLKLRGLMCIPAQSDDPQTTRAAFVQLRELMDTLNRAGHTLDTLSMGMSGDLELAIECGSNLVRVGTDLFGQRGS